MKIFKLIGASATIIAATGMMTAVPADKVDLGKREYDSNCIACHGKDLKGGTYVDFLKVTPPDLTQLSRKNGGVFPLEHVYAVIDGRQEVKVHGPRDMPIWGRDYQIKTGEHYVDMNHDPEVFVRGRIFALIDYLNRMQAK
ncbi:MAG: cytochrome c [Candidatus Dechloromonas phosphoritropha]|jgi:mono/diheme cytochrome c family protein